MVNKDLCQKHNIHRISPIQSVLVNEAGSVLAPATHVEYKSDVHILISKKAKCSRERTITLLTFISHFLVLCCIPNWMLQVICILLRCVGFSMNIEY